MSVESIVTTQFDNTTNKDLFKTLLRDIWDSTDREALVEYPNVYLDESTQDEYERDLRVAGLSYAGEVKEGRNIPIQTPRIGTPIEYTQVSYGTGFRITHRMEKFNKYKLLNKWTRNLGMIMRESKDVEVAKLWNSPTATYVGFDTLSLANNSHTCLDDAATTYDNLGSTALGFAALESAYNYFDYMVDDMANIMVGKPDKLVVNYALRVTAHEILKSQGKPFEQTNTTNYFDTNGIEPFVYHRLTSTTAWYVLCKKSPLYDVRVLTSMKPDLVKKDAPDNTRDMVLTSLQYFDFGFGDPRMVYCGNT